jgi:hypothetical protein
VCHAANQACAPGRQLRESQRELGRESVPTALLYGCVVEHINVSVEEFQSVLARLLRV